MGCTAHIWYHFLRNLLLACSSFMLVIGCNERQPNDTPSSSVPADSVMLWAQMALDDSNTFTKRQAVLKKALAQTRSRADDSTKLKFISKIQWAYLILDDSITFRKTNAEARSVARTVGDSANWARRHWDLAYFFEKKYVKDSAYYHYAQAHRLFAAINDPLQAGRFLYYMAKIQEEVKDFAGSEANIIRAIELLKPLNANKELYDCYNLLGIIAKNLSQYNQALKDYETANGYLGKIENQRYTEAGEKNNIGVVYLEMGEYKKAIPYFEDVISLHGLKSSQIDLYARALTNLAESKFKSGINTDVSAQFGESILIRDSIGDLEGLAGSHYHFAEYYLTKKDISNALKNAFKAKEYASQSANNERLLKTLQLLIQIDPKNSKDYSQRYIKLNDSLQLAERKLRDKFARIRFETDEVVAENELLARQRQLWTGIASSLLLLLLAGLVIFNQRTKNQKLKFQQAQQSSNQEIFNLLLSQSEKLQEGKQTEQKRISEELHDGVQGRLQGARMMLLGLNKRDDDDAKNERARAIVMLKDIQEEVRSISHELSHAAYQKIHNFILSLEDLKTTIAKSADITIYFDYAEHLDWDGLNSDIKINLYRVIQECLQNAVKHAKCTHIDLRLEADPAAVRVSIIDNGVGFSVKKGKKGIGMRNIASRISKVNGTWSIDSEVGKGTTVSMTIPIRVREALQRQTAKDLENV